MIDTVVVIGTQNAEGDNLSADLKAHGCRVLRGIVGLSEAPVGSENTFVIDPTSDTSVEEIAKKLDFAVDMLVIDLDYRPEGSSETITMGQNYDALLKAYNYNTVGPVRLIKSFLPLLERGKGKRICVVTTVESSNNACFSINNYMNHTSKTALNMAMNILFNDLRGKGYSFRLYCKNTGNPAESMKNFAAEYFLRDRSYEKGNPKHSDEDRLVLRNWEGREIPW